MAIVPQFILDSMITDSNGSRASIVITQPRRLSAIGVAARVATERMDDGSVGYAIRGESKVTDKTSLLFCTTGVVLRRLSVGDKLKDVSHIVVDEVGLISFQGTHPTDDMMLDRFMNVSWTVIYCYSN